MHFRHHLDSWKQITKRLATDSRRLAAPALPDHQYVSRKHVMKAIILTIIFYFQGEVGLRGPPGIKGDAGQTGEPVSHTRH